MSSLEEREDCPGDDHPVCPELMESHSKFTTAEKGIIYLSIAAFVIGMIAVCLAIIEK